MPTTPHKPAGWRIEPPVSVPIASGAMPAATHAAEPPLEPPGVRSRSHGLRVDLKRRVLGRAAHGELVHVRAADEHGVGRAELRDDRRVVRRRESSASIREAHVVSSPRSQRISFTATGSPASRPTACRLARRASISAARSSARSASTRKKRTNAVVELPECDRDTPGSARPT